MGEATLKEKTSKGLFWGGLSNGVQQLLGLIFGIFLARLLSPSDYGLVGMLAIFTALATVLQDSGFCRFCHGSGSLCRLRNALP